LHTPKITPTPQKAKKHINIVKNGGSFDCRCARCGGGSGRGGCHSRNI
jgi:hypothetical protein